MNKKIWWVIGIIGVIVLMGIYFYARDNSSNDETIKIGVVAPLTGDAGVYGQAVSRGIEIAEEELDDSNVKVIYEDACVATDALNSARKLVLQDKVNLISGVFCIPSVNAIATLTKDRKIPIMMTASVPQTLIDLDAYVFSPNSNIKKEAYAQAEYAFNNLGVKTASIVWMNSDFGKLYNENFQERFRELGGTIISSQALEFFGSDYRTELTKVKSESPDVLLAVHFGTQMGLILRQSSELELDSQIIGTYESEDSYIIDSSKGGAEGLIFSSPIGGNTGTKYENFESKYVEKYGETPPPIARLAYDGFMIEVSAYKVCSGDVDCVIEQISNTLDYNGASGKFSIGSDGTGERGFVFKTVRDGQYQILE
jgi:branched-chain amino acid transport system substrate-binding protein